MVLGIPDLITALQAADKWLFTAIHGLSGTWLDAVAIVITSSKYWRPVWIVGGIWLLWKGGAKGRWCLATAVACVVVLDPLSNYLIKETLGRLRPFDVLEFVHPLVSAGGGSFPSNHAVNNAAAAVVFSSYYPRLRWLWFSIAAIIALSRVYCGVHWPSDILAGFTLGMAGGYGAVFLTRRFWSTPHRQP